MTLPPPKICGRMYRLHGQISDSNANVSASAFEKLKKLLTEYGLSWSDLPEILIEGRFYYEHKGRDNNNKPRQGRHHRQSHRSRRTSMSRPRAAPNRAAYCDHAGRTDRRSAMGAARLRVRPLFNYTAVGLNQSCARMRED